MAYPICCKYPSHPPADGSSTAKGSARHWFGFNFTVCALLLFTWSLVRSPAVTAYCYNPRIAGIGDKSNALTTTLSLTLIGDVTNPVHLSQHYHWHFRRRDESCALITTLSLTLTETWRILCTYHDSVTNTYGDIAACMQITASFTFVNFFSWEVLLESTSCSGTCGAQFLPQEMLPRRWPHQHPIWEYVQLYLHAPHAATKTGHLYCILSYHQ
jgi:hypothetical protein